MMLAHPDLSQPITWDGGGLCGFVVENPVYFRRLSGTLLAQVRGETGEFVLSEAHTPMEFSRYAEVLVSPYAADMEQTKFQNAIVKELTELAVREHSATTLALLAEVNAYLQELTEDSGETYRYTPLSEPSPLLKACRPYPDDTDLTLAERLLLYFRMCERFCQKKLFVVYHLAAFMTEEEILLLHRNLQYERFSVLAPDGTDRFPPGVPKRIIDRDLCEI